MSRRTVVGLLLGAVLSVAGVGLVLVPRPGGSVARAEANQAPKPRFDVCDVSILFPIPASVDDVSALISVDEPLSDGGPTAWPAAAFQMMLDTIRSDVGSIAFSGGAKRVGLKPGFDSRTNWKVAGIRVDPTAPGASEAIVAKFGETPQIRVIVQPVTVSDDGKVTVHDFAAHLVYSYVTGLEPADPGFLPRAVPDRDRFRAILDDLARLKSSLKVAGIDTQGMPLGVHPGLKGDTTAKNVTAQLRAFLAKHLSESKLGGMAFLGIPSDAPEPWIFGGLQRTSDGKYVPALSANLSGAAAQGLDVQGGRSGEVVPTPRPMNRVAITNNLALALADRRGVSTAALFGNIDQTFLDAPAVIGQDADGNPVVDPGADGPLRNRDIADFIANPQATHFFSADCVSCHTETRRRKVLLLPDSPLRYMRPDGISGVDPSVLPGEDYNVRNFGWFQRGGGPTVTLRAGNETASVVDFINRVYFGNDK
jgi:hypothetical protein